MDNIYQYIIDYKRNHDGNSPTRQEIKTYCGISSTSVVQYRLHKLEAKGLITVAGGRISVVGGLWIAPWEVHYEA